MDMPHPVSRRLALFAGLALVAGCTVQPLYQQSGPGQADTGQVLRSVAVEQVNDRVSQQVRNRLLFLLHRGLGPGSPIRYSAALSVRPQVQDVFVTTAPDGSTRVSARRIELTGTLTLTRIADDTVLAKATRVATASFDRTPQEFANLRAQRDAEDRAAAELAEQFRIVIATALADR